MSEAFNGQVSTPYNKTDTHFSASVSSDFMALYKCCCYYCYVVIIFLKTCCPALLYTPKLFYAVNNYTYLLVQVVLVTAEMFVYNFGFEFTGENC